MKTVRVRFAPSPTGHLHVGGARTALFNWLFARQHQGQFVLRIEDTDVVRSTASSLEGIIAGMRYLGLNWDEGPEIGGDFGPYFQSQRINLYREGIAQLLDKERAYRCFCTPEELDVIRKQTLEQTGVARYDGRCRYLSTAEVRAKEQEGKGCVIRFVCQSEGTTVMQDLIRGTIEFDNRQLDDFVIAKTDGMPTYNFAVVLDDSSMRISHVIRGDDHISNTPKQVQLYEALDKPLPAFAHIPMILGPDKARLSKRHGATSVLQFADEGYLAEAMVNYLALLGWSYNDEQTLFDRQELVEKFSFAKVSKNPAVFDFKKLEWMNGVYIRALAPEQLLDLAVPRWQAEGLLPKEISAEQRKRALEVVKQLQPRLKLLGEIPDVSYYFFVDDVEYNPKAVKKVFLKNPQRSQSIIRAVLDELLHDTRFTQERLEQIFDSIQEQQGIKLGEVIQPIRVASTGTNVSPGIYEVLALLGRAKTCQRLKRALELIQQEV